MGETKANVLKGSLLERYTRIGAPLISTAPIVKALPYDKTTTAKMNSIVRAAQGHVESLSSEVANAIAANEAHDTILAAHLADQRQHAKRATDVVLRLNRRRANQHKRWVEATNEVVESKFQEAQRKIRVFEMAGQQAEKKRAQEFQHLQKLFETQLRLRAPVKLWETREAKHTSNSAASMRRFVYVGLTAIAFGLGIPFLFGDYIANSFVQQICTTAATATALPQGCEQVFSAKGPVTVTGLLLVMSLLMWMARLQYRVHLSERHLALDASEKKAFAETYLAMKEGKDVGQQNEAIVLASLFRPTQDGIIRDDESGMDLSVAALLAKQLGRTN